MITALVLMAMFLVFVYVVYAENKILELKAEIKFLKRNTCESCQEGLKEFNTVQEEFRKYDEQLKSLSAQFNEYLKQTDEELAS
jgi:flagellar biosynthesis chaperone FliJ